MPRVHTNLRVEDEDVLENAVRNPENPVRTLIESVAFLESSQNP